MKLWLLIFSTVALVACGSGSSSNSDPEDNNNSNDNSGGDTIDYESQGNFRSELFMAIPDEERVSCTLNDDTVTTCYKITFNVNGVGSPPDAGTVGPFCPASADTVASESGFGFYDGSTNPGFQLLTTAAANMEIDGYDIIDENGDIKTDGMAGAACLSMDFNNNQTITYLVPVVPEEDDSGPWDVEEISSIGFGVYGVPYKGNPPSVVARDGRIPALDHCGGHADPMGNYYHWHFIPQSMNLVLSSAGYDFRDEEGNSIECKNTYILNGSDKPNPSAFAGLAKDGYPIYGALDWTGTENTEPTDLDECNGHTHAKQDFDDDVVYHYHAFREEAPNHPECLKGLFVESDWQLE